jgi:hypothetical protein
VLGQIHAVAGVFVDKGIFGQKPVQKSDKQNYQEIEKVF